MVSRFYSFDYEVDNNVASLLLATLLIFGLAANAVAQVPQLPPSIDPSRIEERAAPKRPPLRRTDLPDLKGLRPEDLPASIKSARFTLMEIRIVGDVVLQIDRSRVFASEASKYIGHEINGGDIFELARSLTALYRNEGYILSQVIVPPQSLAEGSLTLQAVEGYIANVRVEGDSRISKALLEIGEKIKASRPLQAKVLERYLLIANDFPGVRVRSILAPSQTVGAADLTLIASVSKVEGYLSLDNYGSKYIGPEQLGVGVVGNQLFGSNDQWRFTGVGTGNAEMSFYQVGYSQVLGTEGLKLGASFSRARTNPGDILRPFDVIGNADTATLSTEYPFWRTRNGSLLGRVVYDHRDTNIDIFGSRQVEDRIRALRLGLTWLALDRLDGNNRFDFEYSNGLDGTRQEDLLKSREGADGKFHKILLDYERVQPLAASYVLTIGLGGQWTDEPLLSAEQFALGGRRFGRAYEPAELAGEQSLAFRMEAAYLGCDSGRVRLCQLFGFYDVGKVWYEGNPAPGMPASQSLASAGLGVRLSLDKSVTATLEVAWPLTKPVASYQEGGNGNAARLLGSLVARF